MTGTFRVAIKLGNDTLREPGDIAGALQNIAHRVWSRGETAGTIRDDNGNRVGYFEVEP